MLHTNGRCVDGNCQYNLDSDSELCNPIYIDLCQDITCDDYCNDGTLYTKGTCDEGNCYYTIKKDHFSCQDTIQGNCETIANACDILEHEGVCKGEFSCQQYEEKEQENCNDDDECRSFCKTTYIDLCSGRKTKECMNDLLAYKDIAREDEEQCEEEARDSCKEECSTKKITVLTCNEKAAKECSSRNCQLLFDGKDFTKDCGCQGNIDCSVYNGNKQDCKQQSCNWNLDCHPQEYDCSQFRNENDCRKGFGTITDDVCEWR